MKGTAEPENNLPTVYELVPVLLREVKAGVQKWGVSRELQYFQEAMSTNMSTGENLPPWAMGMYLIAIRFAVIELYSLPNHNLHVMYGDDQNGPWVAAQCSSGAYAEWHTDITMNDFEHWDREAKV